MEKINALAGIWVSAACGRVGKVADRVKEGKRGGWTLNSRRSDTKEPCKLSERCQKLGRRRKTKS